jgi:hypothetical protein
MGAGARVSGVFRPAVDDTIPFSKCTTNHTHTCKAYCQLQSY